MEIKINGTETSLASVSSPAVMDGLSPNPVIGWCCPAEVLSEVTGCYQRLCSFQQWLFTSISSNIYFHYLFVTYKKWKQSSALFGLSHFIRHNPKHDKKLPLFCRYKSVISLFGFAQDTIFTTITINIYINYLKLFCFLLHWEVKKRSEKSMGSF